MAINDAVSFDEIFDDLNSLAKSFLEDSEAEDGGDDEMLRVMIQSLEPELINEHSSSSSSSDPEFQFSDQHHPELEWMIDMEMAGSHDTTTGYFAGRFAENMVEFEGLEDYSQLCYEMAMEEDDYEIGLWQ